MDKNLSSLFLNLNTAARSYGKVMLFDAKDNLLSRVTNALRSLFYTAVSYSLITLSSIYLLVCLISLIANYFNLSNSYINLIYACLALSVGISYQVYSSYKKNVLKKIVKSNSLKLTAKYKNIFFLITVITILIFIKFLLTKTSYPNKNLKQESESLSRTNSISESFKVLVIAISASIVKQFLDELLINLKKSTSKAPVLE